MKARAPAISSRQWAGSGRGIESELLTPFCIANLVLLTAALILGGASRQNLAFATIVEFAALLLLPWTVFKLASTTTVRPITWPLCIAAAAILIPLAQLVPLPASVWTRLPGAASAEHVYDVMGMRLSMRPATLTPDLTIRAALAMVPGIAVFLGFAALSSKQRRLAVLVVLGVVCLSLCLGAIQLLSRNRVGELFAVHNEGSLLGFFANRNHQASLLLCALPLIAAVVATGARRAKTVDMPAILGLSLSLMLITSLAAVKSRAGILLATPALIASVLLLVRARRFGSRRIALAVLAATVLAVAVVLLFGLRPLLARFELNVVDDVRFSSAPDIWRAAMTYFPVGSGLGSFDQVYRSVEPLSSVREAFLNHAHDDYLELILETGIFGPAIVVAFLLWVLVRAWKAWFGPDEGERSVLAQAATVIVALLLVHSALDYPLRTIALSAVLGLACSVLTAPLKQRPRPA